MATRLSVLVNDDVENELRDLALKKKVSVTEIIRRAVSVYSDLSNELDRPGTTLEIVDRVSRTKSTISFE